MHLKKIISTIQRKIKNLYLGFKKAIIAADYPIFKLIEINQEIVTLQCQGTANIFKDKIEKIINDKKLIAGLLSIEACRLGYYYGNLVKEKKKNNLIDLKNRNFILRSRRGDFRISSIDRDGKLFFLDIHKSFTRSAFPMQIVNNKHLISGFDPSQACYIGILAGIHRKKGEEAKKPFLYLIKNTA